MNTLSAETLTALTALLGIIGGYLFRFYSAERDYKLKTELSEKDLLSHILGLQKQVCDLTNQNAELLEEIARLRTQVSELQAVIDGFKTKRNNRQITTAN